MISSCVALFLAASSGKVLLVADDATTPLVRAAAAELSSRDFEVAVEVSAAVIADPGELEERARAVAALAAITVSWRKGQLAVWVADRVTGKFSARTLSPEVATKPAVAAVKVVELLRASLLELQVGPQVVAEVPPTQSVSRLASPAPAAPERLAVEIGVGAIGATIPLAHTSLRVTWQLDERLQIGVLGGLTPVPFTLTQREGTITSSVLRLGTTVRFRVLEAGRWSALAGLLLAADLVSVSGKGIGGWASDGGSAWTAVGLATATLFCSLTGRVALGLEGAGGASLRSVSALVASREVWRWGLFHWQGQVLFRLTVF